MKCHYCEDETSTREAVKFFRTSNYIMIRSICIECLPEVTQYNGWRELTSNEIAIYLTHHE